MEATFFKRFILLLVTVAAVGCGAPSVFAQTSQSVLYVPLIGITSVPDSLALPEGGGTVTYRYAVKNFIGEVALTGVQVVDDTCIPVKFIGGDDNSDSKLDYSETWRYACTANVSTTTLSTAVAKGTANDITATHRAYATVVVGRDTPAPLVSIVNVTKVAYPLPLPPEGGSITFTYKVTNPGVVLLSDVTVVDDTCAGMSGKLGDTNANNLLDISEVWMYSCTTTLTQTTTSTATVTAFADGLKAMSEDTITVAVVSSASSSPNLFDVEIGIGGGAERAVKIVVWEILAGVLAALSIFFLVTHRGKKS